MKLGFEESQSSYSSGSQSARAWTEAWVSAWAYCPHCGNAKISPFPNNSPLADFFCSSCDEEFELKSQKENSERELSTARSRRNASVSRRATIQACS
jgi:type II restriction enzyme